MIHLEDAGSLRSFVADTAVYLILRSAAFVPVSSARRKLVLHGVEAGLFRGRWEEVSCVSPLTLFRVLTALRGRAEGYGDLERYRSVIGALLEHHRSITGTYLKILLCVTAYHLFVCVFVFSA